jgi:hypothetical protein
VINRSPGSIIQWERALTLRFAVLLVLFSGCGGCARESPEFTLDLDALRQLSPENTAGITFAEEGGVVFVTVIDKHGDGHLHRLLLGDLTKTQAFDLLEQKQGELERRK